MDEMPEETPVPFSVDSVRELGPRITVVVTFRRHREFRVRLWIAGQLFSLGAWVANCTLRMDHA
jgi:hypothetical protein